MTGVFVPEKVSVPLPWLVGRSWSNWASMYSSIFMMDSKFRKSSPTLPMVLSNIHQSMILALDLTVLTQYPWVNLWLLEGLLMS